MLGAAIGALVPTTKTEDHLMGETSDQLKSQALDVAQGQIEEAKAAVKSAVEQPQAAGQSDHAEAGEASLVPAESHELSTEVAAGNAPV
jgi:sRNA-binding protein